MKQEEIMLEYKNYFRTYIRRPGGKKPAGLDRKQRILSRPGKQAAPREFSGRACGSFNKRVQTAFKAE